MHSRDLNHLMSTGITLLAQLRLNRLGERQSDQENLMHSRDLNHLMSTDTTLLAQLR